MKRKISFWTAWITMLMLLFSCITFPASAASVDYPVQLLHIAVGEKNLSIAGMSDNAAVLPATADGSRNQCWRFDYVGTNNTGSFYKIVNMGSGRLLTPKGYQSAANTPCIAFGSESHVTQHWYILPADKDAYGDTLTYKIACYENPSLVVTVSENKLMLASDAGADNQKFLLNSAGLQGFGGYCKDMAGKPKASVIGGVLGETVEVTTFDELKKACSDATPRTILITKNISGKTSGYDLVQGYDGNNRYICRDDYIYLFPNKTIIGSYGANTLHNVFFRTYEGAAWGEGNNIILRNIRLTHDKELNYDNNWEFSTGWNFWLDHCTFVGHDKINGASTGSPDFDKFINFKGDTNFITISDCSIGLGEYGVLLGYPTDTEEVYQKYNGTPCVTLCDNFYKNTLTRAPGLMRYGYFHSMNNYVLNFDMGYTMHTAAKIFAESCYYEAGTGKGAIVNDDYMSNGQQVSEAHARCYYSDSGSVAVGCYKSNNLSNIKSSPCTWRPASNYAYTAKSAADAKAWCTKNSGAQSSSASMSYAALAQTGLPSAGYVATPDTPMQPVVTDDTILDANLLTVGEYSSAYKVNNVYTITASTEKTVSISSADLDTADGKHHMTQMIALGGAGNPSQRSIQVTVDKAADLHVYLCSSNPDVSRTVNLLNGEGNVLQTIENISGGKPQCHTFRLPDKGIYYVTSASSGVNVAYAYLSDSKTLSGDVNADGSISLADAVMVQKYLLSLGTLTDAAAADLNGDGHINAIDLTMLKRLLLIPAPAVPTAPKYEPNGFVFSGKVYLVGDSTVCDYDANTNTSLDRYGWGQKLAAQYSGVTVQNLALSGRSSRSFLTEQNYQTLCSQIGKGDYLFIQFGHNDEKTDESTYPGLGTFPGLDQSTLDSSGKNAAGQYSYEWILLHKYIKMAQAKGAVPVIVTPITRRGSDGTANAGGHTKYSEALRKLGAEQGIAVIDMTAQTTQLYTNLYNAGGANETAKMHCWTDAAHTTIDNTHLSGAGANKIASMIAAETKALGLTLSGKLK